MSAAQEDLDALNKRLRPDGDSEHRILSIENRTPYPMVISPEQKGRGMWLHPGSKNWMSDKDGTSSEHFLSISPGKATGFGVYGSDTFRLSFQMYLHFYSKGWLDNEAKAHGAADARSYTDSCISQAEKIADENTRKKEVRRLSDLFKTNEFDSTWIGIVPYGKDEDAEFIPLCPILPKSLSSIVLSGTEFHSFGASVSYDAPPTPLIQETSIMNFKNNSSYPVRIIHRVKGKPDIVIRTTSYKEVEIRSISIPKSGT